MCVQISVGESTLVHIIDSGNQRQKGLSYSVFIGLEPSRLEVCGFDESAQRTGFWNIVLDDSIGTIGGQ